MCVLDYRPICEVFQVLIIVNDTVNAPKYFETDRNGVFKHSHQRKGGGGAGDMS